MERERRDLEAREIFQEAIERAESLMREESSVDAGPRAFGLGRGPAQQVALDRRRSESSRFRPVHLAWPRRLSIFCRNQGTSGTSWARLTSALTTGMKPSRP